MYHQYGVMLPLGPGLVISLMALLVIWTAYRKVRAATHRADAGSDVVRARLHKKSGP
jgi:hypothetical protein